MTLSTTTSRVSYPGPGSGPFALGFRIQVNTDLLVTKRAATGSETTLALTTDYTVDATLSNVTLVTALISGETLVIRRKVPLTQATSIRNQGPYNASTIEDEFDRLVMQLQSNLDGLDRSLKLKETLPGSPGLVELEPTNGYVVTGTGSGFTMSPLATAAAVVLPGNGRTTTTLSAYLANNALYNVKDFGAIGNGVANDTLAMQAAHNTGQLIYYPAGTYLFSNITLPSGGGIIGHGKQKSILSSTDIGSGQLITITSNYASHLVLGTFRDFSIGTPTNVKTTGACIQVAPATGEASYLEFENIYFYNCPIHLDFVAASLWKVINCDFLTFATAGVKVANTNTVDSGDSTIAHCMFNNDLSTGAAILQMSSGGLRVVGNKMLGGAYGYRLTFNSTTTATGTLLINGNSIEQQSQIGISFERIAGANAFKNIVISDNEFGNSQRHISTDGSAGFISELVITGNLFHMNGGAGTIYGVNLNNVLDFLVANNHFRGEGGTSQGVVATICTNGRIGPNYYANIVTANVTLVTCTNVEQWDANANGAGTFNSNWTLAHAGNVVQELQSTDAALDNKRWRIYSTAAGTLIIDAIKDDGSVAATVLTLFRSGANATGISVGAAFNEILNAQSEAQIVAGIDARSGNGVIATLTAARLVGAPTNPVTGQRLTYTFVQGGAGGFAVTWNAVFKLVWADTGNTTGKRSTIEFRYDGANWNAVGAQAPYA